MAELNGVTPLFLKDSELRRLNGGTQVKNYDILSMIVDEIGNGKTHGIQRCGGLWRIYMKTVDDRTELLSHGISVGERKLNFFSENPFSANSSRPSDKRTKVKIHGYAMSGDNAPILTFLEKHNVKISSDVKDGMMRTARGHLTDVYDGTKFMYVETDSLENNQLPRNAYISIFNCMIYHEGQKESMKLCTNCYDTQHWTRQCPNARVCRVCRKPGHVEGENMCDYYEKQENIRPYGGYKDPLSNHFHCEFMHNGIPVKSSEHAFGHDKAMANGDTDLANRILEAKDAREAKSLMNCITCIDSWDEERGVKIMETINMEKFEQVEVCRKALLETEGKTIAEAVPSERDRFWGTGIDKVATENTMPSKWPGKNGMGKILMNVRDRIIMKEVNSRSSRSRAKGRGGRGGRGGHLNSSPRSQSLKRGSSPSAESSPARRQKNAERTTVPEVQNRFNPLETDPPSNSDPPSKEGDWD